MDVTWREASDRERLEELIAAEKGAVQRDRLRAARLAAEGRQAVEVAGMPGRSRRFVQEWAYRYRDGGIDALRPGRSTGRPPKLPREKEAAFKARVLGGPTEADGGVCSLRGEDARRMLPHPGAGVRGAVYAPGRVRPAGAAARVVPRPPPQAPEE